MSGLELYWLCRTRINEPPIGTEGKLAGLPNTARNINTVRRLVARYFGA